jgi:hypothetical protein
MNCFQAGVSTLELFPAGSLLLVGLLTRKTCL